MKITIIQDDGVVGVDGLFRQVDLTDLDENIHAVQFDSSTNTGHVEFDNELVPRMPNMRLGRTKFNQLFNRYVQRWKLVDAPKLSAQELAAVAAAEKQASDDATDLNLAKANPVIRYLVTHTPAECAAYVQTNVTNLNTAKDMLAHLAAALSVIARNQLR